MITNGRERMSKRGKGENRVKSIRSERRRRFGIEVKEEGTVWKRRKNTGRKKV